MNRAARLALAVTTLGAALVTSAGAGARHAEWKGLPRRASVAADSILTSLARQTELLPRRSRGEVNSMYFDCHRAAARLELRWRSDLPGAPDPFAVLDRTLPTMGWTLDESSRADGPDGMVYAFHRGALICVVEGRWEGGDESDTTQVLDPWKSVLVDVASAAPCPKGGDVKD